MIKLGRCHVPKINRIEYHQYIFSFERGESKIFKFPSIFERGKSKIVSRTSRPHFYLKWQFKCCGFLTLNLRIFRSMNLNYDKNYDLNDENRKIYELSKYWQEKNVLSCWFQDLLKVSWNISIPGFYMLLSVRTKKRNMQPNTRTRAYTNVRQIILHLG